jgi:hypothetical protein
MFLVFTLVVALFGWLGWQVRIVKTRQAMAARLNLQVLGKETRAKVIVGDSQEWNIKPFTVIPPRTAAIHPPSLTRPLPKIRRWIGDAAYAVVILREESDCPSAKEWFPEATVVEMNRDGIAAQGPQKAIVFAATGR